jgi:preprotein translocase subunit YajC
MLEHVMNFLAQSTTPTSQPAGQPGFLQWVPIIGVVVIMWLFLSRSKKTQDRKRDELLKSLKKGDRVQTIGGIIGNVVEVRDGEVLLKVDETSNTKIRFARSAIHRVLDEEKSETK